MTAHPLVGFSEDDRQARGVGGAPVIYDEIDYGRRARTRMRAINAHDALWVGDCIEQGLLIKHGFAPESQEGVTASRRRSYKPYGSTARHL